jgi:hypothetical protein
MKEARSMCKWRNGKTVITKECETEVWDKWEENDFVLRDIVNLTPGLPEEEGDTLTVVSEEGS